MNQELLNMVLSKKREHKSSSSSDDIEKELKNDFFGTSSDSSPSSDDDVPEKKCRIEDFVEKTIPSYSNLEFKGHFRLSRQAMNYVEGLITSVFQPEESHHGGRPPVSAKKGIHFFIWYLANQETFRQICDRFNVSPSTGFDIIEKVGKKFKKDIAKNFIKFTEPTSYASSAESFKTKGNLPKVIGAIDGCHIAVRKPKENEADFVNRKGFHSIILQGTCDSNKKIIDIYVGEPGSLHDSRVLRKSPLYRHLQQNPNYLNDYCLLGDSAYPSLPWLVPPYKDNGALTREQTQFNYAHSATRVVIENAFGLLKGRFRRLFHFDNLILDIIINCIISACVLHNICLDFNDQLEDIDDNTNDDLNDEDIDLSENVVLPLQENKRQEIFDEFLRSRN